jgi:hypothetical protein
MVQLGLLAAMLAGPHSALQASRHACGDVAGVHLLVAFGVDRPKIGHPANVCGQAQARGW